ncbi:membrane hypothetical protein [Gammaproteobacteria bacterium]
MKIAVFCLALLPFVVNAESAPVAAASTPAATAPDPNSSSWKSVKTALGVVGGVVVADWIMGGTLVSSLLGRAPAVPAGPVVYSPEVLGARAAGAVLGEMIAPATALRDVAARQDMLYTLVLGVGAAAGGVLAHMSNTPKASQ